MTSTEPYVDIYLLPVPWASLDEYRSQASVFGAVAREHGALSYREFVADDPHDGMRVPSNLAMTAAFVEFESREHRDEVMERVLADPRVAALVDGEELTDMSAMRYGGFENLVTA